MSVAFWEACTVPLKHNIASPRELAFARVRIIANKRGLAHVLLTSIQPTYKRGMTCILLVARPLLLALILAQANDYS